MKLAVKNPNLSVIMPVGCNAKCNFCYWKKSEGLTIERFKFVCDTLPPFFKQISITGGEPTISNELNDYLAIARKRFNKIVLNTNGFKLNKSHFENVDHVNISRHHYDDTKNNKIFNSISVPDSNKLKELCKYGDVTLNCVLEDGFCDREFIRNYISYARTLGAKVAFRKYFSSLDILSAVDVDDTLISSHSCGACLHRLHRIDGVDVTFKYSVKETFQAVNGIYELVLQSNGDLTFDWDGKNKLIYREVY